jgi:hypothetical protein
MTPDLPGTILPSQTSRSGHQERGFELVAKFEGRPSMKDKRVWLSTLWVFLMLNFLYADVMALFDPGLANPMTPESLLAASVLMEVPIAMVLLSRALRYRLNRWANVIAGTFMAVVQVATLFVAAPTPYYAFFYAIEIPCLLLVIWTAWRWTGPVDAIA